MLKILANVKPFRTSHCFRQSFLFVASIHSPKTNSLYITPSSEEGPKEESRKEIKGCAYQFQPVCVLVLILIYHYFFLISYKFSEKQTIIELKNYRFFQFVTPIDCCSLPGLILLCSRKLGCASNDDVDMQFVPRTNQIDRSYPRVTAKKLSIKSNSF